VCLCVCCVWRGCWTRRVEEERIARPGEQQYMVRWDAGNSSDHTVVHEASLEVVEVDGGIA